MKLEQMTIKELLDTSHSIAIRLFEGHVYPWEVLPEISSFIEALGAVLPEDYKKVGNNIWIHKTAKVAPTVAMGGPAIICPGAQIRQGAFLRGSVIVGAGAVIGNSCELKNTIIFDGAQVPHFNYVGDSILGYKAHMGAGAVTSNVKSDKSLVKVHAEDGDVTTGFKKFGAILGDGVEVGCNSVLNPGTIVGKNTNIYPLSSVRGCVPADSIYKTQNEIVIKEKRGEEQGENAAETEEKSGEKTAKTSKAAAKEEKPKAARATKKKEPAEKKNSLKVVK